MRILLALLFCLLFAYAASADRAPSPPGIGGGLSADAVHIAGEGDPNVGLVGCANIGKDRYVDTTTNRAWYCSASNVWSKAGARVVGPIIHWGDTGDTATDTGDEVCAAEALVCVDVIELGDNADVSCSAVPSGNGSGKFMALCQ